MCCCAEMQFSNCFFARHLSLIFMSDNNFTKFAAKDSSKPNFQPEIKLGLDCLHTAGILLFPTDYSWALGCDASNAEALKRLLEHAAVPKKNIVLLVDSFAKVEAFVNDLPPIAWDLNEVAEEPLNMQFDNVKFFDNDLLGPNRSATFRISKEAFSRELCLRFKRPIAIVDLNLNTAKVREFVDLDVSIRSKADYCVKFFAAKCSYKISGIKLKPNNVFEIIL